MYHFKTNKSPHLLSKWPTYTGSAPYSDTCMMLKTKRCPQNIVQLKVENLKLGNALLQEQKNPIM